MGKLNRGGVVLIYILFLSLFWVPKSHAENQYSEDIKTSFSSLYLPGFVSPSNSVEEIIGSKNITELNTIIPYPLENSQGSTDTSKYPNVDTNGFIELKYSGRDYTDDIDKLDTIRKDDYYKKLPMDVLKGDPRFDIRYKIGVKGELDEDLSISYDVEKEPDFPGRYDIKIKKAETELTFGDFNVHYQNGEFIDIKKYLNGIHLSSYSPNWAGQISLGKTKSEPQKFESFATGEREYKLGKSYILENSERVYVNNQELSKDKDYSINYFEGSITFNTPLSKLDYIKVIYEFTNPIQDFIPSLSRKSFSAVQYSWRPDSLPVIENKLESSYTEALSLKNNNDDDLFPKSNDELHLSHFPIILGSEKVIYKEKVLNRNSDYYINYETGKISLKYINLGKEDTIQISYRYYQTEKHNETVLAIDSPGPYYLSNKHLTGTEEVSVDGFKAKPNIDYLIDKENGSITFTYKIYNYQNISIQYTAIKTNYNSPEIKESPMGISVSHISETSTIQDNIIVPISLETPQIDNTTIKTLFNPIDSSQDLTLLIDGAKAPTKDIQNIDYYTGEITMTTPVTGKTVLASYSYRKSFSAEFKINATGLNEYSYPTHFTPPNFPIKHQGVSRVTLFLSDSSEIELVPDQEYSINYGLDGNSLSLSFIIAPGNNYLNSAAKLPRNGDTIRVIYKYSPDSTLKQGKSEEKMTGIQLNYQVNKNWRLNSEYVNSKYSFAKTKDAFSEEISIKTDTVNQEYSLSKKPLVEDSEQVFVNDSSLSRGRDYFINYDQAKIRFENIYPEGTKINIHYDYFSSDVPDAKNTHAIKVNSNYLIKDNIEITNGLSFLDPNFRSIGELEKEKGTLAIQSGLNWSINNTDNIKVNYEIRRKKSTSEDLVKKEQQFTTDANLQLSKISTSHGFRYEDFLSYENLDITDFKLNAYKNVATFGNKSLTHKVSSEISQRLENQNTSTKIGTNTLIQSYGIESQYTPKKSFLLKNLSLSPYLFKSSQKTKANKTADFSQEKINEKTLDKTIDYYGLNSKSSFFRGFDNTSTFEKKTITHKSSESKISDDYYNYSWFSKYQPYIWLNNNYGITHDESVSPIPGQADKIEDRKTYQIPQFKPYYALLHYGLPKWSANPFMGSNINFFNQLTKRKESNYLKSFSQTQNRLMISNFQPINSVILKTFEKEHNKSFTENLKKIAGQDYSSSDVVSQKDKGELSIAPKTGLLRKLSYGFTFNQSSSDISQYTIVSNTQKNQTETDLKNDDNTHRFNYDFGTIDIALFELNNTTIDFTQKHNKKRDTSKTKELVSLVETEFIDNMDLNSKLYQLESSLFQLLQSEFKLLNQDEYYNRNKSTNKIGSLYKKINDQETKLSISPYKKIELNPYYKHYDLKQVSISTINVSKDALNTDFEKRLLLDDLSFGSQLSFTPINFISLVSAIDINKITQESIKDDITSKDSFQKDTYTAGSILRPWEGMEISFDYSIKKLKHNENSNNGYRNQLKIIYQPISYKNFTVDIQIKNTKNWGYGFNEIDRALLEQSSGEVLDLAIIERNDEELLGSVLINIDLPLDNFKYLEKLKITGEGFIKRIKDHQNPDNSLYISGFLFKNTIEL